MVSVNAWTRGCGSPTTVSCCSSQTFGLGKKKNRNVIKIDYFFMFYL